MPALSVDERGTFSAISRTEAGVDAKRRWSSRRPEAPKPERM